MANSPQELQEKWTTKNIWEWKHKMLKQHWGLSYKYCIVKHYYIYYICMYIYGI